MFTLSHRQFDRKDLAHRSHHPILADNSYSHQSHNQINLGEHLMILFLEMNLDMVKVHHNYIVLFLLSIFTQENV